MKWISGIGQRLSQLLSREDENASRQKHRRRVLSGALRRVQGGHPDAEAIAEAVQSLQRFDQLQQRWTAGEATPAAAYDGLSRLKPIREAQQGYILVSIQGFLPSLLEHLIRTSQAENLAQVVFQAHDDPSAHITVLERGHGLAFSLPFFPEDVAEAVLCEFFGELTAVSLKPATFALQTGAPVIPIWGRLDDPDTLTIELGPPLVGFSDRAALTLALLDHFEELIRRSPLDMDWDADCWYPPTKRLLPSRMAWPVYHPPQRADRKIRAIRVLVRTPDTLQEACLAVPAVRALKKGRPDVRVTVLTPTRLAPLWDKLDECDALIELEAEPPARVSFDLAVILSDAPDSIEEVQAFSVRRTVGMETHPNLGQLDEALSMPRRLGPPEHRHRTYLRTAHRLGAEVVNDPQLREPIAPRPKRAAVPVPKEAASPPPPSKKTGNRGKARAKAKRKPPERSQPRDPRFVFGIAPESEEGPSYQWPSERFQEALRQTAPPSHLSWRIFLEPDADTVPWEALREELKGASVEVVTVEDTVAAKLQALSDCDLLLANDNDYLHLAATVYGTPTIGIYGPSDPIQTAPVFKHALTVRRHVECTPCFLAECPLDHRCLREIETDEVVAAIEVALNEQGTPTEPAPSANAKG